MKNITLNYKNNIKKYGRQIDAGIDIGSITLDAENINNINLSFNTSLFKTVMHVLEIDSNVKIEKNSVLNARVGVKFNDSEYEYIEYDNFKVIEEPEKQEDTLSYKILAYDKMIESMIDYDLTITNRITLREYLIKICQRLGWNTNNIPATFINSEKIVSPALHQGIGYTFRDALDEIATISCSFLFFKGENFYLKYVTETNEIIDEEYLSEDDVTIGEEYFINSLVFARAEESDNIYRKDDTSIQQKGLHEYRIADNQLLSTNDRDNYIDDMFGYLSDFKFYTYDIKSTGIMFFDVADRLTFFVHDESYSTIMLNDEINITQGVSERLYVDKPEESETDYKCADTTDRKINQTYILVDKQNQIIESVVNNVTEQNNKISRVEQTVDSLNSKISDIADITTSQESNTGVLSFEAINQSEPIHVEIRPLGENISYLYPFEQLYPSNDLFIKLRTLRFTNIETDEVFDYELPDDLLYYDNDNYDEFILDYDSQSVYINKKCAYDNDGNVVLLEEEAIKQYAFPKINLTDGDYTVEILKYDNVPYGAYLFCRLMAQNIYTTQFATKAEMHSEINQTASSIDLGVNQKLSNYSTTSEMNSAINMKANQITSSVSETYATKSQLNNYSTTTQMNSAINQKADSITSTVSATYATKAQLNTAKSEIKQTTDSISSTVSTKVGNNEVISKINQSSESVTINANKLSLAGKTINLTSDNTVIKSTNFNVDKNGNMSCSNASVSGTISSSNATITGGNITLNGNSGFRLIRVQRNNSNSTMTYITPDMVGINNNGSTVELGAQSPFLDLTVEGVSMTHVGYEGITTPRVTQTSLESDKKNFEKFENALDILKNIDIYKYNLKDEDKDTKKHIGFVIGDKFKYSKEVTSNENNGVDLYSFVSLCCQAIKEQQQEIDYLKQRLEETQNGQD